MIKHWTDKELNEELLKLTVIADSREQINNHITEYFDKKKIPYITRKIDTGDYSAQIGDSSLEETVVIERKHNLDEIAGNITQSRERFEREFLRAKAYGTKVFLIIENASWDDIYMQNYRSKLSNKSFLATLLSWQVRFNITIIFCDSRNTPKLMYGILYYYAREVLLHKQKLIEWW